MNQYFLRHNNPFQLLSHLQTGEYFQKAPLYMGPFPQRLQALTVNAAQSPAEQPCPHQEQSDQHTRQSVVALPEHCRPQIAVT